MSQIKGKDTKPEMIVRRFLHANRFRYRLHVKDLPGKPDIVLSKYKTIIDVRGCFWHGHHNCKFGDAVRTQSESIMDRVRTAIIRDEKNERKWNEAGWNVLVLWSDCELEVRKKNSSTRDTVLTNLLLKIKGSKD